jgi:hypothetical protein
MRCLLMLLIVVLPGCARPAIDAPLYLAAPCSPGYLKGFLEGVLTGLGYTIDDTSTDTVFVGISEQMPDGFGRTLTFELTETPKGLLVDVKPGTYRAKQTNLPPNEPSKRGVKDASQVRKAIAKLPCAVR